MNEALKAELDKIVNTLVGTGIVTRIILFGSCARGEDTPDSDIDLCVLTPVKDKRPIDIMKGFYREINIVSEVSVDLFAYNQEHFYRIAEKSTSFEHDIAENGVLIYG